MSYERKNGDMTVFKNENKKKDNQPDYVGTALDLQGNEVQISLWVKTSKHGKKYFSGKMGEKYVKGRGFSDTNPERSEWSEDDLQF